MVKWGLRCEEEEEEVSDFWAPSLHKAPSVSLHSSICETKPAVCTLIYECNIMGFNNIALAYMTFHESVCLHSAN